MSFAFVTYDGPNAPSDPSVRKLIRRQAMREVAAERKRKGGYGQRNLRQYPVFLEVNNHDEDDSYLKKHLLTTLNPSRKRDQDPSGRDRRTNPEPWRHQEAAVACHPLSTSTLSRPNPEILVAGRYSLLLHLTPLMGLRLGIARFSSPKSENFISGPEFGSRKVLSSIPSRYGHVSSLTHATDCVVSKLQQMMQSPGNRPANGEATILFHYTKALRALQAALDDEAQRTTAETLCATELLRIFEILSGTPGTRLWMSHTSGATQIIQARGAHRFQTEFELALFTANIGPTVMDAFLNNKPCFLAEEQWKQVMVLAIGNDESLADQRDLVLILWGQLVEGPRRFRQVTELVLSPISPPQNVIDNQIEAISRDRDCLLSWGNMAQNQYDSPIAEDVFKKETTLTWPTIESGTSNSRPITEAALWGTYLLCRILKSRLLVALDPFRFQWLEVECQDLAGKIVALTQTLSTHEGERLLDQLFISQSVWIAKGIVETRELWGETGGRGNAMIEKWKFEAWCKAIGRTSTI